MSVFIHHISAWQIPAKITVMVVALDSIIVTGVMPIARRLANKCERNHSMYIQVLI